MAEKRCFLVGFFFFSSRRRHTRLQGDWSSDVCSSDLVRPFQLMAGKILGVGAVAFTQYLIWTLSIAAAGAYGATMASAAGTGNPMRNLHVPIGGMADLLVYFFTGYFLYARSEERRVGEECR